MKSGDILSAMSGIRNGYVEDTAAAMGYMEAGKKTGGRIWRTVLIAAVIAALMTAAALASGLLGRGEREAELPPDTRGEERSVYIPNGFKDSPTYKGSAEWWTEAVSHFDEAGGLRFDPELGDESEEDWLISRMYFVQSPEMLEKLYGIAEKYSLRLYTEKLGFSDWDKFRELTGAGSFTGKEPESVWGYVFEDASFRAELTAEIEGENCIFTVSRIKTGSIYPFQSFNTGTETLSEENYMTAGGEPVSVSVYSDATAVISYVSPDGETYIEISVPDISGDSGEAAELGRKTADAVSFSALCTENGRAAEMLSQPRWAEDQRDIMKKLRDFEESPVYKAAQEFQEFFTENFYGFCFTGTYGMEGYQDIDAELRRLGDKYGLRYAEAASQGNEFSPDARVYNNGAWYFEEQRDSGFMQYHYIPKTALYTGLIHYASIDEYRRCWEYTTACGEKVLLFCDGPDKKSGPYAFYETGSAYVLVQLSCTDIGIMERDADSIDWRRFE